MQRDPTHRGKYGLEQTCLDLYSDPNFFLKQWLDEEEDKRKALRAERKAKKAARGAGAAGPKKAKGAAKKVKKKKFKTEEEMLFGSNELEPSSPATPAPGAPSLAALRRR